MDMDGLIDERNEDLWTSLKKKNNIEIIKVNKDRSHYRLYSTYKEFKIYVPSSNINPSGFTHELLHIYLKTLNLSIGWELKNLIKTSNEKIKRIFTDDLVDHICNCLEHKIMFPIFLKMGFKENEFTTDYYSEVLTMDELILIKTKYSKTNFPFKKVFNSNAINLFIAKYFAAVCSPNKNHNYEKLLVGLKSIDIDLYNTIEEFYRKWSTINFEDSSNVNSKINLIVFEFIENMENWTKGKEIT